MARDRAKERARERVKAGQAVVAPPSPWREVALPLSAIGVGALLGVGYFLGLVGERPMAMLGALVFAVVLAVVALRAAFESASASIRLAGILAALGCLFLALYPAAVVLLPGKPAAEAVLRRPSEQLALPAAGSYRLLVSTHLPSGGGKSVEYRLDAGDQWLEGSFARNQSWRSSRRSSYQVVEVHDADAHLLRAPAGASVTLASLSGETTTGLSVRAFRVLPRSLLWLLLGALIALGAAIEARVAARGAIAGAAAASGAFGLLILEVSPRITAGPVLGSALLAAGGGAIAGALIGAVAASIRQRRSASLEAARALLKRSAAEGD